MDILHKITKIDDTDILPITTAIDNINKLHGYKLYSYVYGTYVNRFNKEMLVFRIIKKNEGTILHIENILLKDSGYAYIKNDFISRIYINLVDIALDGYIKKKKYLNSIIYDTN